MDNRLEKKEQRKHPKPAVLRQMLRALPIPDAGLVLHVLDCPRCAQVARKMLAPKPVRGRKASGSEEVEPA